MKKLAEKEIREDLPGVYPRLWRYCLMQTGTRPQADELAQATCLRALQKADTFTPGTHLDRWLFRMARRVWLNDIRATGVRRGQGLVDVNDIPLADEKPGVETNIFARQVFELIEALPEPQRITVLLVYVEGFSYKEASGLLDIPIGTVMSRLAAARKKLSDQTSRERHGMA